MIELRLPYPPSTNRYFRIFRNRVVKGAAARQFKIVAVDVASKVGVVCSTGPMVLDVTLLPKLTQKGGASKVLLDLDNCLKVAIDSLQEIVFWNDRQVQEIHARYGDPCPDGGMIIRAYPLEPKSAEAGE